MSSYRTFKVRQVVAHPLHIWKHVPEMCRKTVMKALLESGHPLNPGGGHNSSYQAAPPCSAFMCKDRF